MSLTLRAKPMANSVAFYLSAKAYCRGHKPVGNRTPMKEWFEYTAVRVLLKALESLPRRTARSLAALGSRVLYNLSPKLRKTAKFNLRLAFPHWRDSERAEVIRKMIRNLGWMAAEFARLPKYSAKNIEDVVVLDGHDNFLAGHRQGKGVLYLTGHIGAWELLLCHAVYGYPLHIWPGRSTIGAWTLSSTVTAASAAIARFSKMNPRAPC